MLPIDAAGPAPRPLLPYQAPVRPAPTWSLALPTSGSDVVPASKADRLTIWLQANDLSKRRLLHEQAGAREVLRVFMTRHLDAHDATPDEAALAAQAAPQVNALYCSPQVKTPATPEIGLADAAGARVRAGATGRHSRQAARA